MVTIAKAAPRLEVVAFERSSDVGRSVGFQPSLRVVGDRVRRPSRASRFSRRHHQCKCGPHRVAGVAQRHQGMGNHERRRSDFVVQRNGFPGAQVGNHISARAQEHILSKPRDARVVLLESVCVVLTFHPRLSFPQESTRTSIPRPAEPTCRQLVESGQD